MKRTIALLLIFALLLALCGCKQSESKPSMYIEPAQLNEDEEAIAKLLGLGSDHILYDFVVDETVQSVDVRIYRLTDGMWELESGGGGHAFSDKNGRLALGFEWLAEGLRTAFQSENHGGSTEHVTHWDEDTSGMGRATSRLQARTEIVYDVEIPLVMQVMTSGNSIQSYGVETFATPEVYEDLGYEYVYALTITFSQKSLDERTAE